jgi:dihydrofolate reductase
MRKLKLQMQVSVDGFVAGPNGELDWLVWDWDEKLKDHVLKLNEPVGLILLGRKMTEGFVDAWTERVKNPETADWFAHKMLDTPKISFTQSSQTIERENVETFEGDLVEKVIELKNSDGGDMIVYGGAGFVTSLIHHNLIDEYHLFVNPVVIGDGLRIFAGLKEKQSLKLVNSQTFDCGIMALQYEPNNI